MGEGKSQRGGGQVGKQRLPIEGSLADIPPEREREEMPGEPERERVVVGGLGRQAGRDLPYPRPGRGEEGGWG